MLTAIQLSSKKVIMELSLFTLSVLLVIYVCLKNVYVFLSNHLIHIFIDKIIQHFDIRMNFWKQNIKRKKDWNSLFNLRFLKYLWFLPSQTTTLSVLLYDPVPVKFGVRVQGCENKYNNVPVRNDFLKYAEQLRLL